MHVTEKLNTIKLSLSNNKNVKRVFFITALPDTPKHIKYRYYAEVNDALEIKKIGLECVTLINDEFVAFKDIFVVTTKDLPVKNQSISSHVDLFLDLISLNASSLQYE